MRARRLCTPETVIRFSVRWGSDPVAACTALSEPEPAQRYTVQEPGERHMTPGPGGNRVRGVRGDRRGDGNDRDA